MKKYIALMTTAVLAASMTSSCGKSGTSGHNWQNSDTLNEWQIDLLESQGLPTDIEQLTPSQKRSIQHIYEMITYLNEKYDEEFVYAGYVEPGVMDEETLYAYPKQFGSEGGKNTFEVTLDEKGDFTDTYSNMDVSSYLERLIGDYVRSYFGSKDVSYFMSVNDSDINSLKEVKDGNFNWDIGVQNIFFLSNDEVTLDEIEAFSHEFAKWLFEHKIISNNQFNIVRNTDIKIISYSNRATYYHEKYFVSRFSLHINQKGVYTCLAAELSNQIIKDYSIDEYIN